MIEREDDKQLLAAVYSGVTRIEMRLMSRVVPSNLHKPSAAIYKYIEKYGPIAAGRLLASNMWMMLAAASVVLSVVVSLVAHGTWVDDWFVVFAVAAVVLVLIAVFRLISAKRSVVR